MRVAKKYGRVLFAVMFLTLVFTKNVWADDVPPEETVSGSAITEAEVPEETVSGTEIIQKEESVETVPEPEVIKKPKAAISHKQLQLKVKKTKKLSVSHYDGKIKWSSSKKAAQSSLTPFGPMDYILQARILEWVAVPFSKESSPPRDQTQVPRIAGGFFTN